MSSATAAKIIQVSIDIDVESRRPVDLLATASGLSKSTIKRAMTLGAVWISEGKKNRRLRRAKGLLTAGSKLSLNYDPGILDTTPPEPGLIQHEGSYSVWYKPAGMMSSGTRFGDHHAINRWVEINFKPQAPAFNVHRLDRFATGLMLLAHSKQTAAHLSQQFRNRSVKKVYRAIVEGQLDHQRQIEIPLDDKPAISIVQPLKTDPCCDRTLVEITILTGRKHQIRRHLAAINLPLVGDRQYGLQQSDGDLQLTAAELAIQHPITGYRHSYQLDAALLPKL
ncbi:MAG: RNA pseudouridine synthase [Pseudomonadales bacterium]|nr:RNA pseudouridine synthase [Pseudomonadales bacterium]